MTNLKKEQIECHICWTIYEWTIITSWNTQLSGKFSNDYKIVCPKCQAPYRSKSNPNIWTAKGILTEMLSSIEKASKLLFELSITEWDIDKWKELMLEMDYKEWKKLSEEFRNKHNKLNTKFEVSKIEKLIGLKKEWKIETMISNVVILAKKKIIEEKKLFIKNYK